MNCVHILKQKIDRLSANGLAHYTGEQEKDDVLTNSLRGEEWAVDTIVNCGRSYAVKTKFMHLPSSPISTLASAMLGKTHPMPKVETSTTSPIYMERWCKKVFKINVLSLLIIFYVTTALAYSVVLLRNGSGSEPLS